MSAGRGVPPRPGRGFTLVEVLVALVIVAFAAGALMSTLTSSADNLVHLRDKSMAEWIALNQVTELRLARTRPAAGESGGSVEYAGRNWRWQRRVSELSVGDILQIEVAVSLAGTGTAGAGAGEQPALATAWGFYGPRNAAPDGFTPDWSLESLQTSLGGDEDSREAVR